MVGGFQSSRQSQGLELEKTAKGNPKRTRNHPRKKSCEDGYAYPRTVEFSSTRCSRLDRLFNNKGLWTGGLVVFSFMDVVLVILLAVVCVRIAQPGMQPPSSNASDVSLEDAPFCLPCSQVYLNELEIMQNRFKVIQKVDPKNETQRLCCAKSHDDLATFIGTMYMRVHYPSDRAKDVLKETNTTATSQPDVDNQTDFESHLLLKLNPSTPPKEVNGTHTIPLIPLEPATPVTNHHDVDSDAMFNERRYPSAAEYRTKNASVIFHEGLVKIRHKGLYYIYSHVHFKPSAVHLTQFVVRVRNGGELLLLENSVFPCDVEVEVCERSFVGGMFLLEKDDQISPRVSNFSFIDQEKEMRFGLQRI